MTSIRMTCARFGDRLWLTQRAVRRRLQGGLSIAAEIETPGLEQEARFLLRSGVEIDPQRRAETKAAALAAFDEAHAATDLGTADK